MKGVAQLYAALPDDSEAPVDTECLEAVAYNADHSVALENAPNPLRAASALGRRSRWPDALAWCMKMMSGET